MENLKKINNGKDFVSKIEKAAEICKSRSRERISKNEFDLTVFSYICHSRKLLKFYSIEFDHSSIYLDLFDDCDSVLELLELLELFDWFEP